MRGKKKRLEYFSFYDYTGIARHLEEMAGRGWVLEKIGSVFWQYRKTEPKKLKFAVYYYPKASEFDPYPSEAQERFNDYCEYTGWKLAASSAQMQIFYNEREDPIPIETEPEVKVENINNAAKKVFLPTYITWFVISLLACSMLVSSILGDPIGLFSNSASLATGVMFIMMLLLSSADLFGYLSWRRKARKAAKHGEFIESRGHRGLQYFSVAAAFTVLFYWLISVVLTGSVFMRSITLLFLLYFAALFVLVNAVKRLLKRKRAPAGLNKTLTVASSFVLSFVMLSVIVYGTVSLVKSGVLSSSMDDYGSLHSGFDSYLNELPLTVEDMLDTDFDGYIKAHGASESLLLGQFHMDQHARDGALGASEAPEMEYTITLIKAPFLYEMCKNQLITTQNKTYNIGISEGEKNIYEPCSPTAWGAEEAYRLISQETGALNSYMLCYEDRIVQIEFSWTPTDEQMEKVAERLGNVFE